MIEKVKETKMNADLENRKFFLIDEDEFDPETYPQLYNLSSAFMFRFIPKPVDIKSPEFVYIPFSQFKTESKEIKLMVLISEWNFAWEAGQLRYEMFKEKERFKKELRDMLGWLKKYKNENIYLLPRLTGRDYLAYAPLYHLLPFKYLKIFGLPLFRKGNWPYLLGLHGIHSLFPTDLNERLSQSFANYIWPFIDSGTKISRFSRTYPLRILAHNLDYWLPYAYKVAENRLSRFDRVAIDDINEMNVLKKIEKDLPNDISVKKPRKGGYIWIGEGEAYDATKDLVEQADSSGKLRAIIDAVRSNRVEEDFSPQWSNAREDFERKLYKKRSKVKVSFVELNETIPVHGPDSEVYENLFYEDFLGLLDEKERKIFVIIRSGTTKVGDISKILGYKNHSPVSKALSRIRAKAKYLLDG